MTNELRKLAASTLLRLNVENKEHEKRAHAMRLLFKCAELGQSQIPQTYSEFQEKVASLMNQDLTVLEKAIELTGGKMSLGELSSKEPGSYSATDQFTAAVLGDL